MHNTRTCTLQVNGKPDAPEPHGWLANELPSEDEGDSDFDVSEGALAARATPRKKGRNDGEAGTEESEEGKESEEGEESGEESSSSEEDSEDVRADIEGLVEDDAAGPSDRRERVGRGVHMITDAGV